jgi:hypothetical protein
VVCRLFRGELDSWRIPGLTKDVTKMLWIGKSPDNCRNGLLKRKDPCIQSMGSSSQYITHTHIRELRNVGTRGINRREVKTLHAKGSAPYTRFVTQDSRDVGLAGMRIPTAESSEPNGALRGGRGCNITVFHSGPS